MRSRAPREAASPAANSRAAAAPSEPSTPTTIVSVDALMVSGTTRPPRARRLSAQIEARSPSCYPDRAAANIMFVGQAGCLLAFAHLEDRRVEDDMRVGHRELPGLGQRFDLVIPAEEHGLGTGLPCHPDFLPERVVVGLAGLGAEDGELSCGGPSFDEVLIREPLDRLE